MVGSSEGLRSRSYAVGFALFLVFLLAEAAYLSVDAWLAVWVSGLLDARGTRWSARACRRVGRIGH